MSAGFFHGRSVLMIESAENDVFDNEMEGE
jgi:hypothetical protein